MEILDFITSDGTVGLRVKWSPNDAEYDALGWIADYGELIGESRAQLPDGSGWVDMRQFATVLAP